MLNLLLIYARLEIHFSQNLFFCSNWSLAFRFTNYVIKANDIKRNTKQRHFQSRYCTRCGFVAKLIRLTLVSTCFHCPKLENEYPPFMFLTTNNEVTGIWKSPNHASSPPLLLNVSWRKQTIRGSALCTMWPYSYFLLSPAAMANKVKVVPITMAAGYSIIIDFNEIDMRMYLKEKWYLPILQCRGEYHF